MKPIDCRLVAVFLVRERERFAAYLDESDIDPNEGAMIIEDMFAEAGYDRRQPKNKED